MPKKYIGAIIADIHAGAFDGAILQKELKKCFLKYLKSMKRLDFVVIAGDLFDSKISLNSNHTKYIFSFLRDLMSICIEKDAKLRILKGTESHDNQQLDSLNNIMDKSCDVRIINTVESELLYDDFKVLYIPEEYMSDVDDYYRDYFTDTYNMIFGHGMVNEVVFNAKSQQSEVTMQKAPVFKTEKLIDICNGPIFFGHIHKSQIIKTDMHYVGSYSRWCFGEETPKGFMVVDYNTTGDYNVEFIENTYARKFDTIVVDYNSSFYKNDPNQQLDYILALTKGTDADKLRIIFNIPEDYPNPTLLINLINDIFTKSSNVKIVINNNVKTARAKRELETKVNTLLTTYDFLFDKGVPHDEKIAKYIAIKYNKDIPIDRMRDILYQKLSIDPN